MQQTCLSCCNIPPSAFCHNFLPGKSCFPVCLVLIPPVQKHLIRLRIQPSWNILAKLFRTILSRYYDAKACQKIHKGQSTPLDAKLFQPNALFWTSRSFPLYFQDQLIFKRLFSSETEPCHRPPSQLKLYNNFLYFSSFLQYSV